LRLIGSIRAQQQRESGHIPKVYEVYILDTDIEDRGALRLCPFLALS